MDVEIVSSVCFTGSDVAHASCVKAGHWVFLTGIEANDHPLGIPPSVAGAPSLPLHGLPKHRREGDYIVSRMEELLAQAGTSLREAVRLDQYYPTWKAVDPYHLSRKAAFGDYIPPSTSVVMDGLAGPGLGITVSLLAVIAGGDRSPRRIDPPAVTSTTWSGFAPVVRSGDFVFIAGQMARSRDGPPDPRAHIAHNSKWGGYEIRKQAEYIINERLKPALEAAGSSPANAVKAQVYVKHTEDIPHFLDVWNAHFGERQCAMTIVPTSDFGLVDGSLEINLLALTDGGRTRKEIVDTEIADEMSFGASAIRAGDLLLLSGLQAVDETGPVEAMAQGEALPFYGIAEGGQIAYILDQAAKICAQVGTSLQNLVRVHQFHTDLRDFYPMYKVWSQRRDGVPLPFSAVQVPGPMPVPGCTVIVDMWIYAPR